MSLDPVLKTFVTAVMPGHHAQLNATCADFEMRMLDCMEAYGAFKGKEKCEDYIQDLNECLYSAKTRQRITLMRLERARQFKAGERKELWEPAPAHDCY